MGYFYGVYEAFFNVLSRSVLLFSLEIALCPEVFSKVCHDSFCQLGNSVSLPWVIYYGAFYLHVVTSFSCIPVICLKLVLFLIPLQFVHLFCNQSKCETGTGQQVAQLHDRYMMMMMMMMRSLC